MFYFYQIFTIYTLLNSNYISKMKYLQLYDFYNVLFDEYIGWGIGNNIMTRGGCMITGVVNVTTKYLRVGSVP